MTSKDFFERLLNAGDFHKTYFLKIESVCDWPQNVDCNRSVTINSTTSTALTTSSTSTALTTLSTSTTSSPLSISSNLSFRELCGLYGLNASDFINYGCSGVENFSNLWSRKGTPARVTRFFTKFDLLKIKILS